MTEAWRAHEGDVAAFVEARHGNPYSILGQHQSEAGLVLRAFVPEADTLTAIDRDGRVLAALERHGESGFFEAVLPKAGPARIAYRLRATNGGGSWEFDDPYAFGPVLGPVDDYLFVEGTHQDVYRRLGAHPATHEGVDGTNFAVWAPNADRVSVVGDFNRWDGRLHQMRRRVESGIWELFAPGVGPGTIYKYEVLGQWGRLQPLKADPVGFRSELRPATGSIVSQALDFAWTDAAYLDKRRAVDRRRSPMSVYEVHPGSWKRADGNRYLTYDELADQLLPYVVEMGFTHIEFLPVSEHPYDPSWGYQPIGLFAPTSRFGEPEGFARLVDRAHAAGVGIILDWVPAHFPVDVHGLARFDGTALYEHDDPRKGFHPDWNTAIYDFGRKEVQAYLIANARFWLDQYHVDGLRVDAVASMLYLDYSRKEGEWIPNWDGGNDNREAVAFLKRVNELVYALHPGAMTIAEESTSWPGVSAPTYAGGLGFGFKWNMGWMHDTLEYIATDPIHRQWHHDRMTFGLLYGFSENFILPISHDEVVHGKQSIIRKMPGDEWQQFANARAYYGFMWAHPGKKLLFMGCEFGQTAEWNASQSLDWHLLQYPVHAGLQSLVRDLNAVYKATPALYRRDCEPEGFHWLVSDDRQNSVLAWLRLGEGEDPPVAVVSNFTPVPRPSYRIGLPRAGVWREILNTDAAAYGGSGTGNFGAVTAVDEPWHGHPASAELFLPPLATVYFEFSSA